MDAGVARSRSVAASVPMGARDICQAPGRYTRRELRPEEERSPTAPPATASWRSCSPTSRRSRRRRIRGAGERLRPGDLRARPSATSRAGGRAGPSELDWAEPWPRCSTGTRRGRSGSSDGKLNASYNCLDRHVEAGLGDRVAYHWEGEDGERAHDHLRGPARDDAAVRERAQGPRRRARRPRRDLHADGPRGARRDARLRPHRRAPLGRLRRLLGRGRHGPDQRLRGEGAGHGRLLAAARQADPDEGERRRDAPRLPVDRALRRRAPHRRRRRRGPKAATSGGTRPCEAASPDCPAERLRLRADALPALHLGHHREAEGHPAHDRRLHDRRRWRRTAWSSTSSPRPTSTGARPTSAGSPATATSSTGRSRTAAPRSSTRARPTTRTRTAGGRSSSATRRRSSTRRRPRSAPASSGAASTPNARPVARCGCSAASASRSTRARGSGTTR